MLKIKSNCSACGACAQICPEKCITLKPNAQGMVFPEINESKCINCNLCEKVCHLNNNTACEREEQHAYAISHREQAVVNRSTSGGAFTAIAKYALSKGGAVFGCAYTDGLIPRHICAENEEDLLRLNGSKYVESTIVDTYRQTKEILDTGRVVLYSGTPCQIAGLKAFLKKPYENLITVDIVCHGVAPQAYFQKYIDWLESKNDLRITNYDFRSKRNSGWSISGIMEGISNKNGKNITKKAFYSNEYYYYHFLKGTIYRESCYSCKYASINRPGDFSLGDLWGAECLDLEYSIDNGCSLVLANNAKANEILQTLEVNKTEIPLEFAVKYNKQLQHPSPKPESRAAVLEKFTTCSAQEINSWFRKKTVVVRLKGTLKRLVPHQLKKKILKVRYKQ